MALSLFANTKIAQTCRRFSLRAVVAAFALSATAVCAQQADADRDLRTRQSGDPKQDFSLTLSVPLLRSTSVLGTNSDGETIDKPDWHVLPEAKLQWRHQFSNFKLTTYGVFGVDRYFDVKEADTFTLEGGALLEMTDGTSDVFVPYLSYIGRSYFDGDFRSLDDHRHDLAGGIFSGWGWRDGHAVAYAHATQADDQSLTIDVYGGRRLANEDFREHTFAGISLSYTYNLTSQLWLVVTPKAKFRHYANFFDESRRDTRLSVLTKLIWAPEWLTRHLPGSELSFGAEYFHNASTDTLSRYSLWDIGPELKLVTRF